MERSLVGRDVRGDPLEVGRLAPAALGSALRHDLVEALALLQEPRRVGPDPTRLQGVDRDAVLGQIGFAKLLCMRVVAGVGRGAIAPPN